MEFDLLKELKKYKPIYEDEIEKCNLAIEFLETNENCYSRTNLKGHVTAGGWVCDSEGNILLNRHGLSNMWIQFGGHSDGNPNSLEVAIREIQEESGIADLTLISDGILDIDAQLIPYSERKNEPEHYHYDINFLFLTHSHEFKISDESKDIRWVSLSEAKKMIAPFDLGTLRMIDKIEKLYKEFPEKFKQSSNCQEK